LRELLVTWCLVIQHQLASTHTHCLINFLKNDSLIWAGGVFYRKPTLCQQRKWNYLTLISLSNLTLVLLLNIAVGSAHSSVEIAYVNSRFKINIKPLFLYFLPLFSKRLTLLGARILQTAWILSTSI